MKIKAVRWAIILFSWVLFGFKSHGPGTATGKVNMYVSQGRSEEALALLESIIADDPDNADAYFSRAFVNLKFSRHELAIADFTRIISIRPTDPAAYISRGLVYGQLDDLERAASDYQSACILGDRSGCSFADQLKGSTNR